MPAPDKTFPADFHDWMAAELDRKLDSLPSDQARHRQLILQHNIWTGFYDAYAAFGRQPFDTPHPHYGPMSAVDFVLVLGLISARRDALEQQREVA